MLPAITFRDQALHLLDQRVLPRTVRHVACTSAAQTAKAIKDMVVRGAPAIGVAAAYGMALEAQRFAGATPARQRAALTRAQEVLAASRPTAVNLFWALDRMAKVAEASAADGERLAARLLKEAHAMMREDTAANRAIGRNGAALIGQHLKHLAHRKLNVLTHCNAGALATAGYGTALGIVRALHAQRRVGNVWVDETRPFLQGARLTAWELMQDRIPCTLICDNMAAQRMQAGEVDCVIVGADRVAANGDVANKIGTYGLAVLAKHHKIPFYVAAPRSTFDPNIKTGKDIPIEHRAAEEMLGYGGKRWAPDGVRVLNPGFDVTPNALITAVVTEIQ
jgi:methylthioribose-1-phosphate isomerase